MPTLNPKKIKNVKWTDENIQQHPYVAATLKKLFETEEELEETKKVFYECFEAHKRLMKLYKQLKSKVDEKISKEKDDEEEYVLV